jgi:hypothetical protein
MSSRRPVGISVIAILLVLLALAALMFSMTAEAVAMLEGARWHLVQFSTLVLGLTAVVAAVGLWKTRRWGYLAFVAWVAAVVIAGVFWPLVFSASRPPWWVTLVWIGAVALVSIPLARYVKRAISL